MNFPTSTARGFFEILMPGIFLLLNVLVTLYLLAILTIPGSKEVLNSIVKTISNPALGIILFIILGYPLGVVLRLLRNEKIDKRSAKYIKFLKPQCRGKHFLEDSFFYNNWMYEKSIKLLPEGVSNFYEKYWLDKDRADGATNTIFFNFCKTIIAKYDPQSGSEIFAAEALSRFLAGSYYALQISFFLMLINAFFLYKIVSFSASFIAIFIVTGYGFLLHVILSQFRFLRCKEVDTVFHACFANREHFEKLLPTISDRKVRNSSIFTKFDLRQRLLKDLWKTKQKDGKTIHSIELDELLLSMKNESIKHPFISSLYFAGSDVDHPFFLENNKIAAGIAVLPEDTKKAGLRKKHPHQIELIIVLQGSIKLFVKQKHKTIHVVLQENEYYVITKNTCHWITPNDNIDSAAYLFIKTNPSEEPRSEDCET